MNERDSKFFRPLWIRILVTAILVGWCAAELIWSHDELWIGITGFGIAYCVWNFFIRFPKDSPATDTTPPGPPRQP